MHQSFGAFEESRYPMWAFSPDTLQFLAVNSQAVVIFGYSREEFLLMKISEVLPAASATALVAQSYAAGEASSSAVPRRMGVLPFRTKGGRMLDVDVTCLCIPFQSTPAIFALAKLCV